MRRHKPWVAGAAALLLAAVPLSIVIAVNREQARQQAEADKVEIGKQKDNAQVNEQTAKENERIALAVLEFVERNIMAAARPEGYDGGLGHNVTLRHAVEASLPAVEPTFKGRPLMEAQLRTTLGQSFFYMGDAKSAAQQFERARALYKEYGGVDHYGTLVAMTGLANCHSELGGHADALKLCEETSAILKARFGPGHPDTLRSMNNLANSYAALGRPADALKLHEETLALRKETLGPNDSDTLKSIGNVASCYVALGRHFDALKLREETLALQKAALGPRHPETLRTMHNLV